MLSYKLFLRVVPCLFLLCLLSSCQIDALDQETRLAEQRAILAEPKGDYFIGRRYYNPYYKFWGYVREPGQQWKQSKLVMFNEKKKLAPDREINQLGFDDGYEYKLYGYYSKDSVYEPASNKVYPEFILTKYELIRQHAPPIFPHTPFDPPQTAIRVPQ